MHFEYIIDHFQMSDFHLNINHNFWCMGVKLQNILTIKGDKIENILFG